jgi:nucleoside 2-deoxyribosyltransferase
VATTVSTTEPASEAFFAYAGYPALRAETMRAAASALSDRGVGAKTWQALDISGRLVIRQVLQQIDNSRAVLADVSYLNSNVLFELGYAIARDKHVAILFDNSDDVAEKNWRDFASLAMWAD